MRFANAETFTSQFLAALQHNRIPTFKQRYRSVDVLLLDDVQFLENKERTAEEFLYTIEAALNAGRAGRALRGPASRRHAAPARSAQGPIRRRAPGRARPPGQAVRRAILRRLAGPEADALAASGVLDLLAQRVAGNVRSLESALVRARAYASLTQQPLTLELAEQVLAAIAPQISEASATTLSIERIQDRTSRALEVDPDSLASARRNRQVVYARQVAMYLCRELTDHSLPAIALRFGGRDHTTVLHAHRKVKGHCSSTNPQGSLWMDSSAS